MTVIASFQIENHVFMISDILISWEIRPTKAIIRKLPSPIQRFNVALPPESKYTISDLLQKTIWITDRFVLSYAGPVESARYVIRHLRKWASTTTPTGALYEQELATLSNDGRLKGVSLLTLIEDGGRTYSGSFNVWNYRNRKFRYLRAGGSGAKDLLDVFAAYRGKQVNRAFSPFEEGLSLALGLSSYLIGKELVTTEPLQRAYGGIYEITHWNGTSFEHLSEVLHLHWVFYYEPGKGVGFDLPNKIQKVEYHNGALYLRDIDLTKREDERDLVYIVREPATGENNVANPSLIKPNLSYKWLVNHLYFFLPDGKVRYRNKVDCVVSGEFPLRINEQKANLEFEMRSDYFDFLKEMITELDSEWNPKSSKPSTH